MPAQQIAREYRSLFNTSNARDVVRDSSLKLLVEKFIEDHKEPIHISVSINQITDYISNISSEKAVGISGISNKMLKAAVETQLPEIIKIIFEKCIGYAVTPYFFNTSTVKPLIKDTNKDT